MNRSSSSWRGLFAAVLIAIFSAGVSATTYPPTTPPPATPGTEIDVDIGSDAAALAKAKADAAARARAAAEGGDAGSYSDTGDLISNSKSTMLVFPAPVWTTVPGAKGTCIVTASKARSIGWNFLSKSDTTQGSEPVCVAIRMAESARANCAFQHAEMIDQRVFVTIFPGVEPLPSTPGIRNLSLAECEALKKPRLIMSPTLSTPISVAAPVAAPAPVATHACVAAPKPATRRVLKPKPKLNGCEK